MALADIAGTMREGLLAAIEIMAAEATSKSAVSRRFVRATQAKLLARDLEVPQKK